MWHKRVTSAHEKLQQTKLQYQTFWWTWHQKCSLCVICVTTQSSVCTTLYRHTHSEEAQYTGLQMTTGQVSILWGMMGNEGQVCRRVEDQVKAGKHFRSEMKTVFRWKQRRSSVHRNIHTLSLVLLNSLCIAIRIVMWPLCFPCLQWGPPHLRQLPAESGPLFRSLKPRCLSVTYITQILHFTITQRWVTHVVMWKKKRVHCSENNVRRCRS